MPLPLSLFDPASEEPSGVSAPLPAEPPVEPSGGAAGSVLVARPVRIVVGLKRRGVPHARLL